MVCDRASLVKSHSKNMRSGTIPRINLSLQKEAQLHKSARPMGLSTKQQEFWPVPCPTIPSRASRTLRLKPKFSTAAQ